MYFAALQQIDSSLWAHAVRRAVQECSFFPTPSSLRDYASALLFERAKQAQERKSLPDPRDQVTFRQGHPDLPKGKNEGFLEYLERLSIFLGYKTGVNTEDPRADEELAARMRADAARTGDSWADR